MKNNENIIKLRNLIYLGLSSHISKEVALFDLPYHTNIGDGLIWYGEEIFLKKIGSHCIYKTSYYTSKFPQFSERCYNTFPWRWKPRKFISRAC